MLGLLVYVVVLLHVDLRNLQYITLADYAILGDNSTTRMTTATYPFYYKNTLAMRSGSELKEL